MMVTARRLRSIGWMATLVVCVALVMVLAFRVNALRSQVHQSDAKIVALKQETMYLETEFETRANQQQLKNWNDVEFGYVAPVATQYLDNERELASYAKPVEAGAPAPIRVASADDAVVAAAAFPAMVSPLTGRPVSEASDAVDHVAVTAPVAHDDGDAPRPAHKVAAASGLAGLGDRLATVHHAARDSAKTPAHKVAAKGLAAKDKGSKARDAKALAAKKAAGQKVKSARAPMEKSPSRAFAGRAVRPKDRFASADRASADRTSAVGHRHAGNGTPLIKLALKDAKTVK
jgi:hypothetical protein